MSKMKRNISEYRKWEPAQLSLRGKLLLNRRLSDFGLDISFDNLNGLCRLLRHNNKVFDPANIEYESPLTVLK